MKIPPLSCFARQRMRQKLGFKWMSANSCRFRILPLEFLVMFPRTADYIKGEGRGVLEQARPNLTPPGINP